MSKAKKRELRCPECGAPMELRVTPKLCYPNGSPRKFFGCSRYPDCTCVHGAGPDGSPLGTPADGPTRAARIEAHRAFDAWRGRLSFTRPYAYKKLAELLGVPEEEAHMGVMDAAMCRRVVEVLEEKG